MGLGTVVAARVTEAGLARLARASFVRRVELDMVSPWRPPLDYTAAEIGAPAVWAALDTAGVPLSGEGVVVADIDSGIDPFHPMFFRADGAYYEWIDVDEDGRFEPGLDAVDLNANGSADAGESIGFVDGVAYSLASFAPILGTDNGIYEAGWDYLYVDANDNGRRDFGPAAGYSDADPTFGEPLLVADDVNGDGWLDPGERLVALGTSKIRAVYSGGETFERGVRLTEVQVTRDAMHGTGVAGILLGGQRGFGQLTGIAPEAELLLANTYDPGNQSGDLVPLLVWSVQQGADVMLHEYAPWTGMHLDGSSNHETLMDDAAAQGVAQVNPAGNLGGSRKHMVGEVPTGGALAVPVEVPPAAYPQDPAYHFLQVTLLWRDPGRNLHLDLETPTQEHLPLGAEGTGQNGQVLRDGTTWIYAWRDDSPRGTAKYDLWIFGQTRGGYAPISRGTWNLTVSDPETADASAPAVTLAGYVTDDVSGWGLGARFTHHGSEQHLVCFPATADSAIAVAAYAGHADAPYSHSDEPAGALRRYSGRGVRIDGAPLIDIAAPDNPVTALNRMELGGGDAVGLGAYVVFGGTSGAGPHVAGAAALVKQLHPDWDGLQVREAIRAGALVDADVTGDASHPAEDLWGAGKLRLHSTLFGEPAASNTAPSIQLSDVYATVGTPVRLVPELWDAEDEATDLLVRWDDGYDGTWDVGPAPVGEGRELTFDSAGTARLKAQVVDTGGRTDEAVVTVTVVEHATCDGGLCPDAGAAGDAGPGVEPRDGGCGCRAGGVAGAAGPDRSGACSLALWGLLGLLGLLGRRRRSRSVSSRPGSRR
jgi:MYXO-CTERM domain-containing protein